jgi:hypothetical protein
MCTNLSEYRRMKKTLLTGIAALLMATGTAELLGGWAVGGFGHITRLSSFSSPPARPGAA